MKIQLPLGIDNFEKLRTSGCYYIDKTELIQELLEETFEVNLITRPRRFGKTLTMSMLAEFFDIRKDSKTIFENLKISNHTNLCKEWMNQWPVLLLSFKDVIGRDFEKAYGLLQFTISSLCVEHAYLENSSLINTSDKTIFHRLLNQNGTPTDLQSSLFVLTRMLSAHYGKKVILLIDEYDVPLAKASDYHYYDDMLDTIRSLLSMAWKSNPYLKFAVVTGCLRIAKESIFTGANNFISRPISGKWYHQYFGFSNQEVQQLLEDTGFSDHFTAIKKWYNGYLFGKKEVYCPWDVINHVNTLIKDPTEKPANYWKDTSHNAIIRRFIDKPELDVNDKFEILLSGGIIQESIVEDLTYDIVNSTEKNLWSILYLTGYLTQTAFLPNGEETAEGKTALRIPNEEVKTIFADTIAVWFQDTITTMNRKELFDAWWNGEEETLTNLITDLLFDTISYYDYKEDYYHAFVAGLFTGAGYQVASNKEQGTGRADIIVKDQKNRRAIIIEIKRSKTEASMQLDCNKALAQIDREQYARSLSKGYRTVLCYAAAFFEKECLIRKAEKYL